MKPATVLLAGLVLASPGDARALEVGGELSATGWFFGVEGTIEDTDLDTLDFDSLKGQPELHGGLTLAKNHRLGVSYLRFRRQEEGEATATILGVIPVRDQASIDLSVDYLRFHYGYGLLQNEWIDLEPFLELGWIDEESDIRNESLGTENRQDESQIFPLPGLAVVLAPRFPLHGVGRLSGIGTGAGHLIDFEAGLEGALSIAFLGFGYRYVDFLLENDDNEVANVELGGVYVEGGVRF